MREDHAASRAAGGILRARAHGGSTQSLGIACEGGASDLIDFSVNVNPAGPSPRAVAAACKALSRIDAYPDRESLALVRALARAQGIPEDTIVCGAGASDIIWRLAAAVRPKRIVVCAPTFSEYAEAASYYGACVQEFPLSEANDFDVPASFARAIEGPGDVAYLCNPNNPTGTYLAEKDILAFLDKIPPTVMVLFDEAYVEFLEPALRCDSMEIVRLHPNVMVARTFSKAYGLAGARVGYGVAQPGLLSMLNRVRHPFNVNDLSQIAALAALQDQEFVEKTLEVNRKGIKFLSEAFDALGLPYMGLHANFITVKVGPHADDIVQYLLKKGIIVRRMKSYDLPEWIRVSVGTPEQNERFLEVLKEALAKFEETSA